MILDGFKTYIAGGLAVGVGILSQIFGWFEPATSLELVFMGLIAMGLRRAIDE